MNEISLEKIQNSGSIFTNGDYVVILGKKLWVFRPDAQLVLCRADISNAFKVSFISGNRLLIGQSAKCTYRMISLPDGADLWSIPSIRMDSYVNNFIIAPDERYAYDCYDRHMKYHLVKLDIETGSITDIAISGGFRCVNRITCDAEGTPCLLQTQYDEREDGRISQNGIRYPLKNRFSAKDTVNWKYTWQYQGARIAKFFLDGISCILTNDLYVYEPENGREYFLLENDPQWIYPDFRPLDCWLDSKREYIFILYDDVNVVIDWPKGKWWLVMQESVPEES